MGAGEAAASLMQHKWKRRHHKKNMEASQPGPRRAGQGGTELWHTSYSAHCKAHAGRTSSQDALRRGHVFHVRLQTGIRGDDCTDGGLETAAPGTMHGEAALVCHTALLP